jgi:predicted methyltransferase
MRRFTIALAASTVIAGFSMASAHAAPAPATAAAAISDPGRPADDVKRDADRKPADMLAFAGVKPGSKVADLIPGGGYFTRIFAKAVGPNGHVYAYVPSAVADKHSLGDNARALATAYPNVTASISPLDAPVFPEKLDIVWTAQNYHDFHNFGAEAAGLFNKLAFAALKPGGVYVIVDHADVAGSGAKDTNTLHRIDPATVKAEVTAAGFKYVGETKVLANPADPHTAIVFDPSIRGHTDQFVFKFKKPG